MRVCLCCSIFILFPAPPEQYPLQLWFTFSSFFSEFDVCRVVSHSFSSLPCQAAFCLFLNGVSPRYHSLSCWTRPCPAVGQWVTAGSSCLWHGTVPTSPHRGCPADLLQLAPGHLHLVHPHNMKLLTEVKNIFLFFFNCCSYILSIPI